MLLFYGRKRYVSNLSYLWWKWMFVFDLFAGIVGAKSSGKGNTWSKNCTAWYSAGDLFPCI